MKEEELLLIKEQLSRARWSKYGLLIFGIAITILGASWTIITSTRYTLLGVIIFVQFGIICCIIAHLKYGRDHQEKLKELKTEIKK